MIAIIESYCVSGLSGVGRTPLDAMKRAPARDLGQEQRLSMIGETLLEGLRYMTSYRGRATRLHILSCLKTGRSTLIYSQILDRAVARSLHK